MEAEGTAATTAVLTVVPTAVQVVEETAVQPVVPAVEQLAGAVVMEARKDPVETEEAVTPVLGEETTVTDRCDLS